MIIWVLNVSDLKPLNQSAKFPDVYINTPPSGVITNQLAQTVCSKTHWFITSTLSNIVHPESHRTHTHQRRLFFSHSLVGKLKVAKFPVDGWVKAGEPGNQQSMGDHDSFAWPTRFFFSPFLVSLNLAHFGGISQKLAKTKPPWSLKHCEVLPAFQGSQPFRATRSLRLSYSASRRMGGFAWTSAKDSRHDSCSTSSDSRSGAFRTVLLGGAVMQAPGRCAGPDVLRYFGEICGPTGPDRAVQTASVPRGSGVGPVSRSRTLCCQPVSLSGHLMDLGLVERSKGSGGAQPSAAKAVQALDKNRSVVCLLKILVLLTLSKSYLHPVVVRFFV